MAHDEQTIGLGVAQMVDATGVSAHTLRYYERSGLIHPVARNHGNQRVYSEADVTWVRFLLRLRGTGMPIAQIREYADLRARGSATVAARLTLLEAHQQTLRDQIALLHAHVTALTTKIAAYRDDLARPDNAGVRNDGEPHK